ncbi:MAG: molybdenum cofactor guanylyltransferase [Desulfovibrio sp.]|jgi:molybdopterin-guanine dinucleotide biosynthesis protein A|nr:molybdenum cofactor guanylyltransferase [Desulfovibrio sp.]
MDAVDYPAGVVTAGGTSSRLGRDKALLRLHPDGPDILGRTAALLGDILGNVLIVGREHPDYPWIPDDRPNLGPAGGTASALRRCGRACLVLPCDMPFIDAATLHRLLTARTQRPTDAVLTAFSRGDNERHTALPGIYEPGALPFLEQGLLAGQAALVRLIPQNLIHRIAYTLEEALPLFTVNYPADLALALAFVRAQARRAGVRIRRAGRAV